jgi:hypothetical protein
MAGLMDSASVAQKANTSASAADTVAGGAGTVSQPPKLVPAARPLDILPRLDPEARPIISTIDDELKYWREKSKSNPSGSQEHLDLLQKLRDETLKKMAQGKRHPGERGKATSKS